MRGADLALILTGVLLNAVAQLLLKAGSDANFADTLGTTALMEASAAGSVETVKLLLDHGADVNAQVGEKLWFRSFTNDYTWIDPAGAPIASSRARRPGC